VNCSSSTTDKTESLKDVKQLAYQWDNLNWNQIESDVNRLQIRIAKATANGNKNKVKQLQYLLTHSFSAKALAVRKVTTNRGKNTSGVDKKLWSTSASKMKAVLSLTDRKYRSKPLRRVYIAKKGKNQKRPLGIPTMYDRAMQTLYALALEPIAETTGDTISFGFRRGRSAKDACEQIFNVLARECSPKWILEGDIKGCFDNIKHEWLLENIPMDKSVTKQFLKLGFIYKDKLFPTDTGSPQGGAISSLYANMTLDGLQRLIQENYHRNSIGNITNHYRAKTKVKQLISDFLASRGLMLSEEKTLITHIDEGFDFLGWNFRKFKGKLIIKPSKESIKRLNKKLAIIILHEGKAVMQSDLIRRLNQVVRGWTNYHKHVVASKAFSNVNNTLYLILQRWAEHRHPNNNNWWRLNKYWRERNGKPWVFSTDDNTLINLRRIHIIRHPMLQISKTPFIDKEYYNKRRVKLRLTAAA